jgi:ABC-type dipeptide/oligopeptide/nickel transport system permease component
MKRFRATLSLRYFAHNLSIVVGLVLIWRGVWYVLDWIDVALFGGNHTWTAIVGIVLGLLVLYLPDGDLKEIGKL